MLQGFDIRCAPTASDMQTWWNNSVYFYVGIYLGGENVGCKNNTNLTSDWVHDVNGQGWSFLPLWVGAQSSCAFQSGFSVFPNDTTIAYGDGKTAADHAISAAQALGFSSSIIYYDLEPFDTSNSPCLDAAKAFVRGWVDEMNSSGWTPGLYGHAHYTAMDAMYNLSSRPTDAWIAWSDNRDSPWGISYVPDGDWVDDHRIHQYHFDGTTAECHGGVCMAVDRSCAIGPTAMARSITIESTEPAGTVENDGPSEDVAPC